MKKILVFDIETTGVPRKMNAPIDKSGNWPHIVQIAWVLFDEKGHELHRADYIIKPTDYYIPMALTAVHGISHDFALENGVEGALVLNTLYEVLLENKPLLVGHNVKFDISITRAEFCRYEVEDLMVDLESCCTLQLSMSMMKNIHVKFPKLSEIHYHLFQSDFVGHHRAMADVEATARVYFELQKLKAAGKKLDYALQNKNSSYTKIKEKINLNFDDNEAFKKAFEIIKSTNQSLFLTGKAGTGKSTFLKYILSEVNKNIIVVAPTGIAALNVEGVTIHSFFRLPFRPILPNEIDIPDLGYVKKKLIKEMDTLIIDEISMVRVDVLEAIDAILRHNGGDPHQPFGGKQIVLIGDIFQIEPVVEEKDGTKQIIQNNYEGFYFFDAPAFKRMQNLKIVELKKVYRQKNDAVFLKLLDKIRLNEQNHQDLEKVNSQSEENPLNAYQLLHDETIVLKTTNYEADTTNKAVLDCIEYQEYRYESSTFGDFKLSENRLPAPQTLVLKKNAQVMILKNDLHGRWVNGTIAKIKELNATSITVQLQNGEVHDIDKFTWESIKYKFNPKTRKIDSEVIGGFTQFPLRLAWAITIHKSQGLTFDKIKIDWGKSLFASGQVYVALSRCRTLKGISMSRNLSADDILVNPELIKFYRNNIENID
jgi:DNA polymerase III epsilon subunit-like protein